MNIKNISVFAGCAVTYFGTAFAGGFPGTVSDLTVQQKAMINAYDYAKYEDANAYSSINIKKPERAVPIATEPAPWPTATNTAVQPTTPAVVKSGVSDVATPSPVPEAEKTSVATTAKPAPATYTPATTSGAGGDWIPPTPSTGGMNTEPPTMVKYRNTKPSFNWRKDWRNVSKQWGTVFTPFPDPYYGERNKCPDYNLTVDTYWACRGYIESTNPSYNDRHHGECCSLDIVEDMAKHDCGSGDPFKWQGRCYFVAGKGTGLYKKCRGKRTRFNQAGFDEIRRKHPQTLNNWTNYCGLAWQYIDKWCVCD